MTLRGRLPVTDSVGEKRVIIGHRRGAAQQCIMGNWLVWRGKGRGSGRAGGALSSLSWAKDM